MEAGLVRVAAATSDQGRNDKAMLGLIERCAEVVPEGTTSLTLSEAQFYVGRQIQVEIEKVRFGDDDHVRNLVGADARRQVRNRAVTEVYSVLLRTRGAFETVFGPGTSVKLLGLDNKVPDDPVRLYQTGDRCRRWLRDPQMELPAVDLPGFNFDREAMAQGDTAAASLEARLQAVLEDGEEMPDVRHLFRLLERLARRAGDDLDQADGDRFVRAMRLKVLQEEARRTKAELHAEVVKVRKTLVELYGSAHVRFRFGLAERTPRGTADLADEARRLAVRLDDPDLVLPEPRLAGLTPDPEGWVRSLKPPAARLDRLVNETERRRIGASDGVLEQQRALAAFDETYLRVAQTAEALLRLGGEKELARRLRPKARRKTRRPAIVQLAVSWWCAVAGAFQQLRGIVARSIGAARDWVDVRKSGRSRQRRANGTVVAPEARKRNISTGTGVSQDPQPLSQRWHGGLGKPPTSVPALADG